MPALSGDAQGASRFARFKAILAAAAGDKDSVYRVLGCFWELPHNEFVEARCREPSSLDLIDSWCKSFPTAASCERGADRRRRGHTWHA
jgi:hypothetical protein